MLMSVAAAAQSNPRKAQRQLKKWMKRNNIHWHNTRYTATGKHTYYNPGFGGSDYGCNAYGNLPTKESTFKRHVWWKPAK